MSKTTELTKTEVKILQLAVSNAKGGVSATTSKGLGVRANAAIRSLSAKGLLTDHSSYTEWAIHRGRLTLFTTHLAFITDAGRNAIV